MQIHGVLIAIMAQWQRLPTAFNLWRGVCCCILMSMVMSTTSLDVLLRADPCSLPLPTCSFLPLYHTVVITAGAVVHLRYCPHNLQDTSLYVKSAHRFHRREGGQMARPEL